MFEFLAHGKLKLSDEAEAWPWSAAKQERWMAERRQLTDEMVEQFREGCALLQAMSSREYDRGESKRYRAFQLIDKKLTWSLIGPHSCSVFDPALDGPPHKYLTPSSLQYTDWPAAQTWRKALIEASGVVPRKCEVL